MPKENKTQVALVKKINDEVAHQLADPSVMQSLVESTFKDFTPQMVKSAIVEAMIRGFSFKNILEKDIYPIKYGNTYSLITSVHYFNKVAARSGLAGVKAPEYSYKRLGDEKGTEVVDSCTVTVLKRVGANLDEYTATVFFDEYNTGKNLWQTKPKTMIAKVARAHAFREAFPEEMSQMFAEEEMEKITVEAAVLIDTKACKEKIQKTMTMDELKAVWIEFTADERNSDEIKKLYKDHASMIKSENKAE